MFSFLFPCFDFRFSVPCQIFFAEKRKEKEKRKESFTDCFQVPFSHVHMTKTRSSADADNGLDVFSSQSNNNMVPFSVHCNFSLSM